MKIINFGSVNIDRVYRVAHFVRPGETLSSASFSCFPGGKGFNQSTALARAGAEVRHAGRIGEDGLWLKEALRKDGADVSFLRVDDAATGHAVIQVDDSGQNCILLSAGANAAIREEDIREVFASCGVSDILLLQNEISLLPEIMRAACKRGMRIVLNPAPMSPAVLSYPLESVSLFIVNEVEAAELSGVASGEPGAVLEVMRQKFPEADVLLTLGARGALARERGSEGALFVPACAVTAVDTTAAGDTFIGYFLAERQRGGSFQHAMEVAAKASSICVSRMGAAPSIPWRRELF